MRLMYLWKRQNFSKKKDLIVIIQRFFYKNDKLEFYKEERKKYWLQVDEYAAPTLCMAQKLAERNEKEFMFG